MKTLFKKIAVILTLSFATSIIQADDTFSHSVLLLPDDPRTEEAWNLVINSQEVWESFYNQSLAYTDYFEGNAPVAPILDFENNQVLAGGLGIQNIGGALLVVESVQEQETSIAVHVLVVRPSSNCGLPIDISYPSTTILVKKTDKPFSFSITELTNASDECANVENPVTEAEQIEDLTFSPDPENAE